LSACAWNAPDERPAELVAPPSAETGIALCDPWLSELASPALAGPLAKAREIAGEGDFEAALCLLDRAGRNLPPEPALHAARASLLCGLGFPRAAELEFERAVALEPGCPELWQGLGIVRLQLGLEHEAEEALTNARGIEENRLELALTHAARSDAAGANPR
jgi:tetratricopeptide (TPR) repeat protein